MYSPIHSFDPKAFARYRQCPRNNDTLGEFQTMVKCLNAKIAC